MEKFYKTPSDSSAPKLNSPDQTQPHSPLCKFKELDQYFTT